MNGDKAVNDSNPECLIMLGKWSMLDGQIIAHISAIAIMIFHGISWRKEKNEHGETSESLVH
jgi:hypothetical protein